MGDKLNACERSCSYVCNWNCSNVSIGDPKLFYRMFLLDDLSYPLTTGP